MTVERVKYKLVATMDTSRPMGGNTIHDDAGAQGFGFQSALVVGGYVYAWAVPAILNVLGNHWLSRGWVGIQFRRPVYVGDELTALATREPGATAAITVQNQRQEACLVAEAGLNDAPWLQELLVPTDLIPQARPSGRPPLTLERAPAGKDLRPMRSHVTDGSSRPYLAPIPEESNRLWSGPEGLVHPGWIVGRMTGLALHSYTFSPSIAAAIRVQHLARFQLNQQITIAGHFRSAYERNGHHYSVVDGLILGEDGTQLVQVQQTTIFKVAKRH
jgi:hypothetical protein